MCSYLSFRYCLVHAVETAHPPRLISLFPIITLSQIRSQFQPGRRSQSTLTIKDLSHISSSFLNLARMRAAKLGLKIKKTFTGGLKCFLVIPIRPLLQHHLNQATTTSLVVLSGISKLGCLEAS